MKRLTFLVLAVFALGADAATLRWANRGDPQTTDPHSQNEGLTNNLNQLVYEFLVGRDKKLNLEPQLAVSWEQVSPTVWRFKLRQGVKFHNGEVFDAAIVKLNWEENTRLQQPFGAGTYMNFKPGSRLEIVPRAGHAVRPEVEVLVAVVMIRHRRRVGPEPLREPPGIAVGWSAGRL